MSTIRKEDGTFPKGRSGNPRGRPKGTTLEKMATSNTALRRVLSRLSKHLPTAVDQLAELITNKDTPPTVRAQASKTILTEYKDIYQMLELDARKRVDDDNFDDVDEDEKPKSSAPIVDFSTIIKPE